MKTTTICAACDYLGTECEAHQNGDPRFCSVHGMTYDGLTATGCDVCLAYAARVADAAEKAARLELARRLCPHVAGGACTDCRAEVERRASGIPSTNAKGIEVGDLVQDHNFRRTCAVVAARTTRVLVAVRMKSTHKAGGKEYRRYQLRWRPITDVTRCYVQKPKEALALAVAAFRHVYAPTPVRFVENDRPVTFAVASLISLRARLARKGK